ncbi:DNA replication/repair protein RecF [Williamsia phyllosphaerae]|uniref:DNA replication and repair protein RecF n=1 Tax=Williamsia phyllosphaerae TaxID=885042 RepID=A0ABQ1UF11_9NOCA|nr:DNA replication/repair protein RecF [Williamsia phyllosphaerae]GGF16197.1 DNA replication and repair protein RecF [Williamsia phyllosphaerae]
MYVRTLRLRDFRSWQEVRVDLGPEPTIFVGRNGFGKTNLVESLNYLSTLRSHRVSNDAALVRTGCDTATASATVINAGRELTVELQITPGRSNRASVNGAPSRRPRDILGILRTVMFAPEDLALVRGDPADRRRFVDELAALAGPRMVAARADYDRVLRQRSALLKTAASAMRSGGDSAASVISTLDVWDTQLAQFGAQVTAGRIEVLSKLRPFVQQEYSTLAPASRPIDLRYRAVVGDEVLPTSDAPADEEYIEAVLLHSLAAARSKEIERGVCLIGPHRDDIDITLAGQVAKGFASHGESWSLALAMRLGSVELIRSDGAEPVVLLDDVFAELDAARRAALSTFAQSVEQVIITAAVADDIPAAIGGRRVAVGVRDDGDGGRLSYLADDDAPGVESVDDGHLGASHDDEGEAP